MALKKRAKNVRVSVVNHLTNRLFWYQAKKTCFLHTIYLEEEL